MPKRSSKNKTPEDPNELADFIVETVTEAEEEAKSEKEKNPAAVVLGRLGGKKGGSARAKKLTKEERSAIARRAANARWSAREM
jgi:hypothetical protein